MIQSETLELLEWSRLCQHLSNFAATKLGVFAARNIQIPTTLTASEQLLKQTQQVYDLEGRTPTGLSFEGIQDIGDSLERAELKGLLAGDELLAIATTLAGARNLRRTIENHEDLDVLLALVADLRTYPEVEQEIHRCIDERGHVADRASSKLAEVRSEIRRVRSQINQKLQNIIQVKSNALQEGIITQRGDRYVLPVKASHKDVIPGIVHDTSTSGVTLYVEPNSVVPMGNQLRQLLRREEVEEEAIRRALTGQIADIIPDLERLLAIITVLDLACARSRYSQWLKGNPPRFVDPTQEQITLRQLHHPLLLWQQQYEQGHPVVPVDLRIEPHIRVVTITGPNTGGKTVTLKTLGLAALMAKVGLFIPAREPVEIPWFEQVLADIGDEQSLQQSLSTFSGHIRRISRILTAISPGESPEDQDLKSPSPSLILLDEVGAGTDPVEGSALAIALLRYLADHALLTMATTHFGELKALKYEDLRFENASVEFDEATLSPTYRLLWGIPGRSNALAIASRLGLKPEVIAAAKQQMGGVTDDVNLVIAGLEDQRRRQEIKAAEAQNLLQQAEKLYKEVSAKADALQEREQALKASQEAAVQEAIAQAKKEIAQVIRRLQQGTPTGQDAQNATNAINQIAEKFIPQAPPKPKPGYIPKIGERIRIPKLGQTAEVLTAPDADREINVRFGIMKMTVKLDDIESLDGQKPEPSGKETKVKENKTKTESPPAATEPLIRTSRNTIDLRGKRVADAEYILDQAIAQAHRAIWIIHGHGTGKLRQGVHEYLRQHPRVSKYEPAEQADGGTGVTIAYIVD
ncbi:endonuclease MutS2 [Calothrix sp. NIES-3974]|uniref:endonuclease MutS2 n=1 Tax=Calothrix sp. NIES-3974 TaxID=2005462 RepID=UPI000B5F37F7|nr:endonuclease MutS2 [Calothrix sp. NIES-3974]BAZ04348.1 recombination and DNA strand exchange inhibitor protein [Calothrix sp. NIES-3974]